MGKYRFLSVFLVLGIAAFSPSSSHAQGAQPMRMVLIESIGGMPARRAARSDGALRIRILM